MDSQPLTRGQDIQRKQKPPIAKRSSSRQRTAMCAMILRVFCSRKGTSTVREKNMKLLLHRSRHSVSPSTISDLFVSSREIFKVRSSRTRTRFATGAGRMTRSVILDHCSYVPVILQEHT